MNDGELLARRGGAVLHDLTLVVAVGWAAVLLAVAVVRVFGEDEAR
jgi:hypothetical protein